MGMMFHAFLGIAAIGLLFAVAVISVFGMRYDGPGEARPKSVRS